MSMVKQLRIALGLIAIFAIMVSFTIVGCKADDVNLEESLEETTEEAAEDATEEESTEEVIEEEAEVVVFDKPVTITVLGWHPTQEAVDRMVAAFEEVYPNITVEFEIQLPEEYFVNIKSAYTGGAAPDIGQFQPGAQISPFTQFLEPLAPIASEKWGSDWQSKFFSFANDQVEWTGKEYYMLPQGWTPTGLYANTRLLEDYGLEAPRTLDDLLTVKDTIGPDGHATFLCGFKTNWNAMDLFFFLLDEFAPGEFYTAEQGESSFESEGFLEAVNMWKYFFDEELIQAGAYSLNTYMESVTQFMQGNGAIVPLGSWHLPMVYTSPLEGSQIGGFAPITFPDLNGDGVNPRPTVTMGSGFGITKDLDEYKKEAAWTFLEFILTGEGAQIYADDLWQFIASTEIAISPSVFADAGELSEAFESDVQWYFDNAEAQGAREPQYAEIKEGIFELLSSVAVGTKTPEEALADLQSASEAISK